MGMSASQARFLSLTSRMHDLEYQAQAIDYAKLALSDDSNMAYEEYTEAINSTKLQMRVVSGAENNQVDVTYAALIASANQPAHTMYALTDTTTGNVYLPESVVRAVGGKIPESLDAFLTVVAQNYVYAGKGYSNEEALQHLKMEQKSDYWTSVYYQMTGYKDDAGNIVSGRGMVAVPTSVINDRDWIKNQIEEGKILLNVMQNAQTTVDNVKVNIFAETNIATNTDLSIAADEQKISRAEREYENKLDNINDKDKRFDLRLHRIENERSALKTELETVKQLIDKNIERGFKTFNA